MRENFWQIYPKCFFLGKTSGAPLAPEQRRKSAQELLPRPPETQFLRNLRNYAGVGTASCLGNEHENRSLSEALSPQNPARAIALDRFLRHARTAARVPTKQEDLHSTHTHTRTTNWTKQHAAKLHLEEMQEITSKQRIYEQVG